jgi:lipopolysaccharide export system protein LptA
MIARHILIALACVALSLPVAAQTKSPASREAGGGTPNAMQGFSKNKGQPINIEAERLEVRDKDKVATFIGNVQVIQGDTSMRCKTLVVYYDAGAAAKGETDKAKSAPRPSAQLGNTGEQKIKKLEARGDVVVTQKDQVATGELAIFEMDTNTVTMTGNVVLTQGQNVLRGSKLVVDMTTGFSRVESGSGKNGRVQGLFVPSGSHRPGAPDKPHENKPAR